MLYNILNINHETDYELLFHMFKVYSYNFNASFVASYIAFLASPAFDASPIT